MSVQLGFPLPPKNPYSLHYLVLHSGIQTAVDAVSAALTHIELHPNEFRMVVVYGESGSGKTHLLKAHCELAISKGISSDKLKIVEFSTEQMKSEEVISQFISTYEERRREGGVLLVSLPVSPANEGINPHLKSRLLADEVQELERPSEDELESVFTSVLLKKNMKLGERSIGFLLRRIPANTLSFEAISDRLDELFREDGRGAKFSVVREIIGE